MRKLFALLLSLVMFSIGACGGGDDEKTPSSNDKTPSSSQPQKEEDNTPEADSDESKDKPDNKGGKNEWPAADFITDAMTYAGTGNIVSIYSWNKGETYQVFYDSASVDEVAAYVAGLKDAGFVFKSKMSSPKEKEAGDFEKGFYVGVYTWQGTSPNGQHVSIRHSDEPSDKEFRDSNGATAQLIITLYATDPELP